VESDDLLHRRNLILFARNADQRPGAFMKFSGRVDERSRTLGTKLQEAQRVRDG